MRLITAQRAACVSGLTVPVTYLLRMNGMIVANAAARPCFAISVVLILPVQLRSLGSDCSCIDVRYLVTASLGLLLHADYISRPECFLIVGGMIETDRWPSFIVIFL
jgi:hypothetical protein